MSCSPILSDAIKNYIIIGGGPVGCYLAYKLLNETNSRVFIFEGRQFERPQVIIAYFKYISYSIHSVQTKLINRME